MYCSVFLCIALYSSVLLFIASGKLAVYDSVAAEVLQIIWEHRVVQSNVLNSIVHESVAAGGSTNDMAALSCPIERT